jgi:hypothetical protein
MKSSAAGLIMVALVLAGCGEIHMIRSGTSFAQQEQDAARCRLVARGLSSGGIFASGSAAFVTGMMVGGAIGTTMERRENYRDCMKAQGYHEVGGEAGPVAPMEPVPPPLQPYRPMEPYQPAPAAAPPFPYAIPPESMQPYQPPAPALPPNPFR